jgi:hypothetical protein
MPGDLVGPVDGDGAEPGLPNAGKKHGATSVVLGRV